MEACRGSVNAKHTAPESARQTEEGLRMHIPNCWNSKMVFPQCRPLMSNHNPEPLDRSEVEMTFGITE